MRRVASAFLLAALAACSTPGPTPFYAQPALAGAPHGTLIAVTPLMPSVPGAAAYRVLYDSEDISGQIIPVSGLIYVPTAPAPAGGRNVVAWAHPTTGIAPGCAPSLEADPGSAIPGLADFIAAGDVVAATDYQGLGAPGVHPYLIGQAEGQDILDSVLAAQHLPGAELSGRFAVWGHSQGAQAALFAGQLAGAYTPGLDLAGVAAAAPPTDMKGELTEPFHSDAGRLLAAYIYDSWSITYHVPITTVVYPQVVPAVDHEAGLCINSLGQGLQAILGARALRPLFWNHPPQTTPPWPALFDKNSPGNAPAGAPLLVMQGADDPTVEPHWTVSFVNKACARGDVVDFHMMARTKHLDVAVKALPVVEHWIAERFAGDRAKDSCKKAVLF